MLCELLPGWVASGGSPLLAWERASAYVTVTPGRPGDGMDESGLNAASPVFLVMFCILTVCKIYFPSHSLLIL